MPSGGHNRKPSELKKLEGNRAAVGRGKIKTDPRGIGVPQMPVGLSAEAKRIWAEVVSSLPKGILSRADEGALEIYVNAWTRLKQANRRLKREGLTRGAQRNPLLLTINAAEHAMMKAGGELGLTPVARARLASREPIGDEDPLALLLHEEDAGAVFKMPSTPH